MSKEELIERLQEILDMHASVMREHHGRPDCKTCALAEVIQELLDKEAA